MITIQPQPLFFIQVFSHPPIGQGHSDSQDITGDESSITEAIASKAEKVNTDTDIKNYIRRTALQTLIPKAGHENIDTESNVMENKELTELEELDNYYDFDYVSDLKVEEENTFSKSVFHDVSDEKMSDNPSFWIISTSMMKMLK